jgi:hypothetical protein
MPQSISIAVLVLGGVLLLVAITGGKFKIFGAEVDSAVSSRLVRLISGTIGIILVTVALTIRASGPAPSPAPQASKPDSSDPQPAKAQAPAEQAHSEPASQVTSPMGSAIVFDPPSNIREAASATSNILCSVTQKTTIHILRLEGNWYVTDVCGGKPGYIYRNQIKF